MKLRLLGPLELATGRSLVSIGGPRQRVVLSVLAMNANRVTPIDLLIQALWGEAPPETARAQIQTSISSLRKLFGGKDGRPDAIQTRPPGYLLEVAPTDLDSQRFTDLVAEARGEADRGRLADAAATLRTALALWRGPMLADIDSDLVQREAASFAARKITAIEKRIRIDLALGWHEAICGELAALVEEYPLNERLSEFWMLALYRCGRQADALEAARRTRATLVAELGIEPGHDLQRLETAILNRDPSLDLRPTGAVVVPSQPARPAGPRTTRHPVPGAVPRQLPPSVADFTGREAHIAAIKQLLAEEDLDEYAMRIVAISGKGGVGKSSLAVRVAHELGELFPDGQLYGDLASPAGEDSTTTLLARFLRALGVEGAAVPDDPQERAELYRSTLAGKRVLVVLDDVTSEQQVLPLLPGSGTCAVITTSRMRLSGLFGAHWLDIDVLDAETSLGLLAKIIGPARVRAEQDVARELVRICGGLPLALRIAGARLASRPHWRIAALVARLQDEAGRLDELTYRGLGLRFNIDLTYRSLAPQAKRLFRLFVLLRTPDLPAWTAAALLDTELAVAEEVLEQLVDAQLLDAVEYPGERLRYRFHSLIRIYAMERLLEAEPVAERDQALHRVLAAWLAFTERAHREEYGGDYTVLHGTAPRWYPPDGARLVAADNLMDWWDAERAALVAAVRHAAAEGLDELCWDLALTSTTLFEVKGYYDDWRETAMLGLQVTERAGNRRGHAAMLYSLGTLDLAQKRLPDAEKRFAEALGMFTADGDEHGRALVLRNSALVDGMHGDSVAMLAKYQESLALMRVVGDRMGEAQVLRSIAAFRIDEGDTDRACELLDESLAICREVGCLRGEAQVRYRYASLRMETGDFESARRELARVRQLVNQIGDRIGETYALYGLGVALHREGSLDDAEATAQQALALARMIGERLVEGQVLYLLGEIGLARADVVVGAGYLTEAETLFEELGSALWLAKTLILQSVPNAAPGCGGVAVQRAERARDLLRGLQSKEAARLLAEFEDAGTLAESGAGGP
ncbi:AfsR/SARP family transcriptional regulator [Labedaea rhizosphaerae]|uniref:DNA-binding SARP family transcriptional activator n=1 Tax=Labedaea rhizosphaerae TaxID=598644 RepID=A0A4R6S0W0_LABRH|nr:AfsR/SARP family transcriptional regulator [Labedaea rhizosphaerae]TDP92863.1 DNA-binding SARP family transcriptional activator [Labedaea rhizosphaerae]